MAVFKPQRKTSSGIEDLDIDAATLDGKDSSYYLNYNNLTNKPTVHTTDTWRTISVNGATIFGGATNTAGLNLQKGNNVTIEATAGSPNVTISATNTTYTFDGGTNGFTVTPKGGTAQTVTVTPSIANATTSKAGLMSSTDKTNLDTLSNLLGTDSDAVVNKINEVIEIFDSYPEGNKIADALAGKQSKVAKLGSTTKPVYVSAAGTFAAASTYAGGTKVTLNGTDKGASTASLYAPTTPGTDGQILKSNGSGAPTWVAQSVIDLGVITEDPASATNSVLNAITDSGIYVFKFYSSDDRITDCYIMTVNTEEYDDGTKDVYQHISNMGFSVIYYRDGYTENSEWFCNLKYPQSMGSTTCSSNYDNKKLYLVGATSQAYEANTYSNKKIYIDQKNSLCSLSGGITVNKIWARTNNPDDYGYVAGSTGQVLKTNGTYVYWDENTTDFTGDYIYLNADDSELIVGPDDDVYIDKSGISTPTVKTTKYYAPSYSGAPQISVGAAGQVLMSNGTTSYWGNVSGGGTSSFNSAGNITADLESQRRAEIDLDCDRYKELIVCTSTQDDIYELSDNFGNTVSCKEKVVMHLNYMSEDEMLIGTMTSDTGVSKPFISSSLSFFAESANSITLDVIIYGR